MEEKEIATEEELEVQDTFNDDSLEELNDSECCTIENEEEVDNDEHENE